MSDFNVAKFFEHDHDELDRHLAQFRGLKNSNYPLAKEHFKSFKFGLQRHIIWEEELLFPLFEDATRMKAGPTVAMRAEHKLIRAALEGLHKKVQMADPDSALEENALADLLKTHHEKEAQVLYPAIDQATTEQQRQELQFKINTLPPERYAVCCNHHVTF